MKSLIIPVVAVTAVVLLVWLCEFLDPRGRRRRLGVTAIVKDRLNARESLPRDEILRSLETASQREMAWLIMSAIADELDVEPSKLRLEDRVDDVVTVTLDGGEKAAIHSHAVLNALEERLDRQTWKAIHAGLQPTPQSEDALMDALFQMSLLDLVRLIDRQTLSTQ